MREERWEIKGGERANTNRNRDRQTDVRRDTNQIRERRKKLGSKANRSEFSTSEAQRSLLSLSGLKRGWCVTSNWWWPLYCDRLRSPSRIQFSSPGSPRSPGERKKPPSHNCEKERKDTGRTVMDCWAGGLNTSCPKYETAPNIMWARSDFYYQICRM